MAILDTQLLDRESDRKTARFILAVVIAAFLVMSIGPSVVLGATPSVAAGSSLGDGVDLGPADADLHAAPSHSRERHASISIVGGTATTIQKWPWQVALALNPSLNEGNARDRQICGGSLVTPRIVLSAARCFFDSGWSQPSQYAIVSGRTRLSSSEGVEVPVDDYFYLTDSSGWQLYNPNSQAWDVVVVRLGQPVTSQPIKLASAGEARLWAAGRGAFATGWGATNPDADPDVLQVVSLSIVDDNECRDGWGADTSVMLCAFVPGRDTCQGDSGGPLVVAAGGGQFRLVGDTSFGGACGSGAVYGRLSGSPMRERLRDAVLTLDGVDIVVGVYGKAAAQKTQRQKGGKVVVKVRVNAKEALDARVSGKIEIEQKSYSLKVISKSVAQGRSATLKLKPARSGDVKKIANALKKSRGKAKIGVTLSDDAGNSKKSVLSVSLQR